jgi:hypothetical protein
VCIVETFTLLGCCLELVGSLLLMFQDSVYVSSVRVKQSKKNARAGGCMTTGTVSLVSGWQTWIMAD